MSEHKGYSTLNYNRFTCIGCYAETVIEPGQIFTGKMNCKCEVNKTVPLDDKELSTVVLEELDYVKTQTVTVIGKFDNGDYEVCNGNDLSDTWRVPKDTFEGTYELVKAIVNAKECDIIALPKGVKLFLGLLIVSYPLHFKISTS